MKGKRPLLLLPLAPALAILLLPGRIDDLQALPPTAPADFLASMPHVVLSAFGRDVVLIQPSSTFLVYLLGVLTLAIGLRFVATRRGQASRELWGAGLAYWGLGALAAGTSYQAFGYMLKGAGRATMAYTSGFELSYLLLTSCAIDLMVAGIAHAATEGRTRRFLLAYAPAHALAYIAFVAVGAWAPIRFLVSYEGFMAMHAVQFLLLFGISVARHRRCRDRLNRDLAWLWIGFLGVNLGYFAWMFSGAAAWLSVRYGVWFHENDVLHLLLLAWMAVLFLRLRGALRDAEATGPAVG